MVIYNETTTDQTVSIVKECTFCHNLHTIIVDEMNYRMWKEGELIQNAFPDMPAEIREILISGTDNDCWNQMFPDEDE